MSSVVLGKSSHEMEKVSSGGGIVGCTIPAFPEKNNSHSAKKSISDFRIYSRERYALFRYPGYFYWENPLSENLYPFPLSPFPDILEMFLSDVFTVFVHGGEKQNPGHYRPDMGLSVEHSYILYVATKHLSHSCDDNMLCVYFSAHSPPSKNFR